jgi:hypothetical protein
MTSLVIKMDDSKSFDLAVRRLLLSSESISENSLILSSVSPIFTRYIDDVKSRVLNGYHVVEKISSSLLKLDLFTQSKKKDFDKVSFIDISVMLITVLEGFNGNLYDYSVVMETLYSDMTNTCIQFLNSINIELGRIVNNKSNKISTENLQNIYLPYQKLRLDAIDITGKFFAKHSTKSRETLGNVFNNKKEIYDTFENADHIERKVKTTDIKGILNLVDDTTYLLNEINKQIQIDNSIQFSPQVIDLLGNGIKEAALSLEYLSTLFYDTDVLLNIISGIDKDLSRVIRNV